MARSNSRISPAAIFFALLSAVLAVLLYRAMRPPAPAPVPSRAVRPRAAAPAPRPPASRRAGTGAKTSPAPDEGAPARAKTAGPASIAILIDDLGNDRAAVDHIASWPYPVSAAVLPALAASGESARQLQRSGKEVLLHLPMEPRGFPGVRPGPGVVLRAQSDAEIAAILDSDLDSVPGAVGVNNHMGSAATADPRVMRVVSGVLARRGLFFVDSRTTDTTVARDAARAANVPTASRRVFLDDVATEAAVESSLAGLFARAREEGSAIAIGHPHPATLAVLDRELPRLAQHGVKLVKVSELVE